MKEKDERDFTSNILHTSRSVAWRHTHAARFRIKNIMESVDDEGAVIRLQEPQFGIAAGQAAAIYDAYDSQNLLGGGWITVAPLAALAV